MKILVIGSDGFIGRAVVELLSKDHAVTRANRKPSGDEKYINLLDKDSISTALKSSKPETIINCAGIVENSEAAQKNIIFSTNLLEATHESGVRFHNILICGSAAEYGIVDPKNIPVSENTPLNANAGYGLSKLREEQVALKLAEQHNLQVVVVRIFNPIGVGMHSRLLIPKMIQQVREFQHGWRETIEISRLDAQRDYIHVGDVASAIKALAEGNPRESVYNIGSGVATSNKRLVELIIENSELDARPQIAETASDPEPLVAVQADINRIKQEFAWEPTYTLGEAIKEIVYATRP